ncbi:MAG: DUF2304 domain-containing protein [Acidobacteria bacterium]|nr:DUF2304 domain-containing protein [Acidobacteriota bacterium]
MSEAARFIGIADPAVALLLLAGSVFLVVFFRFSMIISRLRDDNVALAQKLAILEYRLEKTTAR